MCEIIEQGKSVFFLSEIISYLESTSEESWCINVVKTKDGKSCVLGHIFDYGEKINPNHKHAGANMMDYFECRFANSYMIYGVNDGTNENYPQSTPKQRVLAYLKNMQYGKEKTILDLVEEIDGNLKKM